MTLREIEKIQAKYEKKLDEWETNHQLTGGGKFAVRDGYKDIIDLCILARSALENRCLSCERTERAIKGLINSYKNTQLISPWKDIELPKIIEDIDGLLYAKYNCAKAGGDPE